MGRIKVNLASGSEFDKPLITCFKGTNGNYIVLDNEANGSMGLPIICIGRLEGTTISKIVDPTEWTAVKENLKTIIGGTSLPYLPVPENLSASDDFYTQLTLPIASFELLKNTYNVPAEEPAVQPEPVVAPVEEVPVASAPEIPESMPIDLSAIDNPVEPVVNNSVIEEQPVAPIEEAPAEPAVQPEPIVAAPEEVPSIVPTEIPVVEPVSPIETPITEEPPVVAPFEMDSSIVTDNTSTISDQDLKDMKETFMKSCENMFDALVEKLKK